MSTFKEKDGVWFVYDGDCPICTHAANALRIKQEFITLSTLNARDAAQIPIPLTMILGAGNAVEYPIDDNIFGMEVSITHPWWGQLYGYKGRFEVCH